MKPAESVEARTRTAPYALSVLTVAYTLSVSDQGLIGLMLDPIKQSLGLSDSQLGVLTGIAFGALYALAGLPISRWADRGNRVTIAAIWLGVWSVGVGACMFTRTFVQLLITRMCAALGAAGTMPPTYSLVGDFFPDATGRTRALTIYTAANSLSLCLSFGLGGLLASRYGWKVAFGVLGGIGTLVALILWATLVEPRVHQTPAVKAPVPMRAVIHFVFHVRTVRNLTIALVALFTMGFGLSPWYAAFMMRSHGADTAELGVWFAGIFGVCGLAGTLLGGFIADYRLRGDARGQLRMVSLATAATVPFLVLFLLLPRKPLAFAAFVPFTLLLNLFFGPTFALLQRLAPGNMRATAVAVVMLLCNLIGMGVGPQLVGSMSDLLASWCGMNSLRWSMLAMGFMALGAAFYFWQAGKTVELDLKSVETQENAGSRSVDSLLVASQPGVVPLGTCG